LVSELSQERAALGLLGPRRATLKLWVAVVALVHFDRGAATVAAMDVSNWGNADSHGASFGHAVVLLAWHSIGLAVGNSLAGSFFQQASAKAMLLMGLTASLTFSLAFGLQESPGVVITAVLRLGSGVAAALPLVYLPFWVANGCPSYRRASQLGSSVVSSRARWQKISEAGEMLCWARLLYFFLCYCDWRSFPRSRLTRPISR